MPENRLEKKRKTVQEQLELQEKKNRNRKASRIMKPVPKPSEPTNLTVVLSVIFCVILGLSFTAMVVTTFGFKISYWIFVPVLGLWSWGVSYAWMKQDRKYAIIPIAGAGLLAAVLLFFDLFSVRSQFEYFYTVLQQMAWRGLPVLNVKDIEKKRGAVTLLMVMINLIPAYFTSWTIVRRKHILLSVIWYIPFLLTSTIVTYVVPAAWPCELAVAGVMLLLIFQFVRRLGDQDADVRMLKLVVPVLLLCFVIGAVSPKKDYARNKVASKRLEQIDKFVQGIRHNFLNEDPNGSGASSDQAPVEYKGYLGSVVAGVDGNGTASVNVQSEDLTKVGYFDPPDIKIMEVTRVFNEPIPSQIPISGRHIYLKSMSMEIMEGNSWRTMYPEGTRTYDSYYEGPVDDFSRDGDFIVTVRPGFSSTVYFVPSYVDHYCISRESKYASLNIAERLNFNLNETTANPSMEMEYSYAYNDVPQRIEVEWDPEYLEEVYTTCLEVPEVTRQGIMESGLLPDWYLELLEDPDRLSSHDKVHMVIEYVRKIHPYRHMTPYPPEGSDFVTWFMTESESGFCVHFATTAAVLLRMVGVPTRYVSGYLVVSDANGSVSDVSMRDAHAWIEYFDPEFGWILDDPTPGNGVAAGFFNVSAISKEYDIDYHPQNYVTPEPTPTKAIRVTAVPTEEAKEKKGLSINWSKFFLHPVWIAIYILIGALLVLKVIYNLYWRIRFSTGDLTGRAASYRKYFALHQKVLSCGDSRVAQSIVKKAEYSEKGIGKDDLQKLIRFGRHHLMKQRRGRPLIRKILSGVLLKAGRL